MPFETNEIAEVVTLAELQAFLEEHRMSQMSLSVDLERSHVMVSLRQRANVFVGEGKTIEAALRDGWTKRSFR